nr:hypothetical protein [Tanacetum cinerariifolium]
VKERQEKDKIGSKPDKNGKPLVDGKKVIVNEAFIRRDLRLDDAEGSACLPNDTIFKGLVRMRYEKPSQKLTFYKAFFSPQWKFLIHTILQCLSAKTTAWNEFSSIMASAIIYLANNQKFNFSKYILENMVKNLEARVKFLMFPRFLQVFLDKQVEGMAKHKEIYVISSYTKKVFANMRRQGQGFSGNVTSLFETMMVNAQEEVGEEDASKQGRSIEDIDQDARIVLVDKAQGRMHDADMFGVDDLKGNEVILDMREKIVEKEVSTADPVTTAGEVVTAASVEDSAAPTTATTADVDDELTLEKTLIAIKEAKPKVISTAATIVSTAITTPRAKGIGFHKQVKAHTPTISSLKDKGKAKMIEPKKPLKRKDQIALDEEVARKLEVEMKAEIERP